MSAYTDAMRVAYMRLLFCLVLMSFWAGQMADAQAVYRVTNHNGGPVAEMEAEVRRLSRSEVQVRIGPGRCMSSCTMLLGARNVCVYPDTQFGFHGPSSQFRGVGLPPADFDHWSRLMADHYPPVLRGWFLSTGRYELIGFYSFTGQQIIDMGVPSCL